MIRDKLLKQIGQLDADLDELLQDLQSYDAEALNAKPAPSVWSPLQVLHHMRISEQRSLDYVEKKLSYDPHLRKSGLVPSMRSWALSLALVSPFKFKPAPGTGDDAIPGSGSLQELSETWRAHRKHMRQYVQGLDSKWLDKAVYKHPFVGRLDLQQMLLFFAQHFARHRKQLYGRLGG